MQRANGYRRQVSQTSRSGSMAWILCGRTARSGVWITLKSASRWDHLLFHMTDFRRSCTLYVHDILWRSYLYRRSTPLAMLCHRPKLCSLPWWAGMCQNDSSIWLAHLPELVMSCLPWVMLTGHLPA